MLQWSSQANCLNFLQMRRPLLSIPKTEPRGRSGARLSTTRRSIQPKNKPLGNGAHAFICLYLDERRWKRVRCLKMMKKDEWPTLKVNAKLALHFRSSTQVKIFKPIKILYLLWVCWLELARPPHSRPLSLFLCCLLYHLPPDWLFSLCSVSCLCFKIKKLYWTVKVRHWTLNPSSPPCNGSPLISATSPNRALCMSVLHYLPDPCLPPLLSRPCLHPLWWCWCVNESLAGAVVSVLTAVFMHVCPTAHGDQKRSVTFTENQGQQASAGGASKPPTPSTVDPPAEGRGVSPVPSKSPTLEVPPASSATITADLHRPTNAQVGNTEIQNSAAYSVNMWLIK